VAVLRVETAAVVAQAVIATQLVAKRLVVVVPPNR
jgi:hypothetical protein